MLMMTSIREIFRIGMGPSSSHTMGPEKACRVVMAKYPEADRISVTLYGSLSRTGKGHRTDYAIEMTLGALFGGVEWDMSDRELKHPNTMVFHIMKDGKRMAEETVYSVGGGAIRFEGEREDEAKPVYHETTFDAIHALCTEQGISLSDYVYRNEPDIREYLMQVWEQMQRTVEKGLITEGELPGGLHVKRRACELKNYGHRNRDLIKKQHFLISAYAYAACEENAAGGRMVTAPTCGASGVLPAVLYYEKMLFDCTDSEICDALAVAGLMGQLIRTNASVSGAVAGCQAEVGSACSMAAAALCVLRGFGIEQIECAAELAMEHCLGLTCDPVGGLVQIPCIERNAVGALRAWDAAALAEVIWDNRKVSFDTIVTTMYETGKDLSHCYRETSEGGLARTYKYNNKPV